MSDSNLSDLHLWQVLGESVGKDRFNFHRIVGIGIDESGGVFAIALQNLGKKLRKRVPIVIGAQEMIYRLGTGLWHRSKHDPCIPKIRQPEDIKEGKRVEYLESMHYRHAIVLRIVSKGWAAFDPVTRERLVQEAQVPVPPTYPDGTVRPRHSNAWIRKLLSTYWTWGGTAYGLLPGQVNNGAVKREALCRAAKQEQVPVVFPGKKTGPHATRLSERPDLGPHVTPEIYAAVKAAIKAILENPDYHYALSYAYNQRRAIPWVFLRRKVNEQLAPKEVHMGPDGPKLETVINCRLLTRRQVKTIAQDGELHLGDFVLKVKSHKSLLLDHRPPQGDRRDAVTRTGQRYSADVLYCDVFAVNDKTRLPIGRIYLVFVVDGYSSAITGVYVWAGDPDFRMITYALASAAMPKSEWGKIIGEQFSDEECPYQGLPETMVCDNGEAARHCGDRLADLTFDIIPNPPFHAFLNQAAETSFNLFDVGVVKWYPASTKGPRMRHAEDQSKKAIGSVAELLRQASRWAFRVANFRELTEYPDDPELVALGTKLRPIDLWLHGRRVGGGALRKYVKERHLPALLESVEMKITEYGIDFDGIYYDFPKPVPDWFHALKVAATAGPAHTVRIHFDRASLNRVYLVPKDPNSAIEEIPLSHLSRQWKDYSRKEYQAAEDFRKSQSYGIKHEYDVRVVAFEKSLASDKEHSKKQAEEKFGSLKERDGVASVVGQAGPIQEQMRADAERDQAMHPSGATAPVSSQPAAQESTSVYERLLGLE